MSLLMKALEKAAKDRSEARQKPGDAGAPSAPPASAPPAAREPQLEPIQPRPEPPPPGTSPIPTPAPKNELSLEPIPSRPFQPATEPKPAGPVRPKPPPRDGAPDAPPRPAPRASSEQDRAATVMQASTRPSIGVGAYTGARPVLVFVTLAVIFALGFGVYLYLQIFHPSFFIRQAPRPTVPPPLAQGPVPPAPEPGAGPPLPLTAALLAEPRASETPAPAAAGASGAVAAPARPPLNETVAAPPQPAEPPAPRNTIVVSPGTSAPRIDPLLNEAYAALAANRIDAAEMLYERLIKNEPRSIDAMLGLAAVALREGRSEDAIQRYLKVIELDPRNPVAQSGLIALLGRADPLAAETRLKQLIAREPSAHLYFVLGNLYADQSLWAQAQHAYFQAYHLEPSNPDYAYNLAVGLEHVGQQNLALGFYRRAVTLAAQRSHVNFDIARAQERVSKLAAPAN